MCCGRKKRAEKTFRDQAGRRNKKIYEKNGKSSKKIEQNITKRTKRIAFYILGKRIKKKEKKTLLEVYI